MIVQTSKAVLGVFKGDKLMMAIQRPGAKIEYSENIYTHAEADTIENLMAGKDKLTALEVRDRFNTTTDEEVLAICDKLGIAATLSDLK